MLHRSLRRLAAAVLVTAAAGFVLPLVGPAAPADAAACPDAGGVTVVVDFNELGGGIQGSCVADGAGRRASELFPEARFQLAYSDPGFVCRVSGLPDSSRESCVDTPPDTAYWGLWWSTGKGTWTYSNYGVSSLKVPAGSWVAFAWKQGTGSAPQPGVTPSTPVGTTTTPTPTPVPSATPTTQPTQQQTQQQTQQPSAPDEPTDEATSASPTSEATSEATTDVPTTTATPGPSPSESPTSATPTPSDAPTTAATSDAETVLADPTEPTSGDAAADDASSLPGWMAPLIIVLLLAIAGVAAVLKRRQTP